MSENKLFNQSLFSDEIPVEEQHLIEPMLLILAKADLHKRGPVGNFEMSTILSSTFVMSEKDEEVVRTRGSSTLTRFQRTINNVISHDILTKHGWAKKTADGLSITNSGYIRFLDGLLEPKDAKNLSFSEPKVAEDAARSFESTIAFRMLVALAELQKDNNLPISTTVLKNFIKSSTVLSPEDVAPLQNRVDAKIDQIIRNIVSHNTLTKNGYAKYQSGKGFNITKKGKTYVSRIMLASFPTPDFDNAQRNASDFKTYTREKRIKTLQDSVDARKVKATENLTAPVKRLGM